MGLAHARPKYSLQWNVLQRFLTSEMHSTWGVLFKNTVRMCAPTYLITWSCSGWALIWVNLTLYRKLDQKLGVGALSQDYGKVFSLKIKVLSIGGSKNPASYKQNHLNGWYQWKSSACLFYWGKCERQRRELVGMKERHLECECMHIQQQNHHQ